MCDADVWGGFITKPEHKTVSVGENAKMKCHSSETQAVNWQVWPFSSSGAGERICYNGDIVDDHKNKYSIDNGPDPQNKAYHLVIHDVKSSDAGEYTCIERAGIGESASANLTVTGNGRDGKDGIILLSDIVVVDFVLHCKI